ncbi:MAG: cation diffusion facilitator family transporter [Thermoleophilia bacterium]|jgi:cation diffusion facilitator family transporter
MFLRGFNAFWGGFGEGGFLKPVMTDIARKKTNVAILSVVSNSLLVLFKLVVGLLIGSVAVISEAIHSGVDLLAAIIALFAVRASAREADERHPYGHGKFENMSGTIEALLIFAAAAWIIYEAVQKLRCPEPVSTPMWGVAVMFLSAVANFFVSRRLFKIGKETDSVALQADGWHLRTDVYTSVGVMAGLLILWLVGLARPGIDIRWLDPVIGILVALLILKAAWDLTREAGRDLLDVSLPEEDVAWIQDFVLAEWPQVRSFHQLRTRKAGPDRFIDFHLVLDGGMSIAEAHALGDEIVESIVERLPSSQVNIHIEPCDHRCSPTCKEGCVEQVAEKESEGGSSAR